MVDEPVVPELGFLRTVSRDIRSNVDPAGRSPFKYWLTVIGKAVLAPQVHVVILFRISHVLWGLRLYPFALMLRTLALVLYGAEIHPGARIGAGFCVVHTNGVIIGRGVVMGTNCRVAHGTSIGEMGRGSRLHSHNPTLGNDVTIGIHAVVVGPITVGNGVVVGANSVLTKDVPDLAVVSGIPAKVIRMREE